MKKLLLSLLCFIAVTAYAQDTVKKATRVGDYNEDFMVLKSSKKVRQGSYQLSFRKKMVANGKYDQGKRTGIWNYYDNNDKLVQQYDFTANKMVSAVADKDIMYNVSSNQGDVVVEPVLIGGLTAGLRFIASFTNYADNFSDVAGKVSISHSINLDENGKISKWTTVIKSFDGLKVVNPSFDNIPEDLRLFTPAMVNGKAIASVISFKDQEKVVESNILTPQTKIMETKTKGRGRN
jgi:hypothetical protein